MKDQTRQRSMRFLKNNSAFERDPSTNNEERVQNVRPKYTQHQDMTITSQHPHNSNNSWPSSEVANNKARLAQWEQNKRRRRQRMISEVSRFHELQRNERYINTATELIKRTQSLNMDDDEQNSVMEFINRDNNAVKRDTTGLPALRSCTPQRVCMRHIPHRPQQLRQSPRPNTTELVYQPLSQTTAAAMTNRRTEFSKFS